MTMNCGIYQIKSAASGKVYIGSSVNIDFRFYCHRRDLRLKRHANCHLQNAYNRYGSNDFTFMILELCSRSALEAIEQSWLDRYDSSLRYNILPNAYSPKGRRHSNEFKEARRQHGLKPEVRARFSKIWKGRQRAPFSVAHREKLSIAHSGKSTWNKGKTMSMPAWNNGLRGTTTANSGSFKPRAFSVIDPNGTIHSGVNLRAFAISAGLHAGHMASVNSGKEKSYRGWTKAA